MIMKKLFLAAAVLAVIVLSLIYLYPRSVAESPITIRQARGSAILIENCSDKNYVGNISDYIIVGTVEKVESMQSEGSIFTYSDISIGKYEKGIPFSTNKIQIVTPGGTIGNVTQFAEDQPILHQGKDARLYISQNDGEFSISCGIMGVEEIQ